MEKYLLLTGLLAILVSFVPVLSVEEGPFVMNASISQPVAIILSENLTEGILFTNDTMNDTQVNITVTEGVWHNAIRNYIGNVQTKTGYWVQSSPGNAVNITVCHCACDNLICQSGLCAAGTDYLIVACSNPASPDDCVGFANETSSTKGSDSTGLGTVPTKGFSGTLTNQVIGALVKPGEYVNLRYWLDPNPDNAPTGIYQTNFKIYAVEYGASCGACTC